MFLLSKRPRYFYDADAIREPHAEPWRSGTPEDRNLNGREGTGAHKGWDYTHRVYNPAGANARSVWQIPTTTPYAHFATWPQALVRRMILAGCPEGGTSLTRSQAAAPPTSSPATTVGIRSGSSSTAYLEIAAKRLQHLSLLA